MATGLQTFFYINPLGKTVLVVAGTSILIKTGQNRNIIENILSAKIFLYIGNRSYSWYIWHLPVITFTRFIWPDQDYKRFIAICLSFLLAIISFKFIENPIRNLRVTRKRNWAVLLTITIFIPLSTAISLSNIYYPKLAPRTYYSILEHLDVQKDCQNYLPLDVRDLTYCNFGQNFTGRPIYLIGDSNAGQYTEPLLKVSTSLKRPLIVMTFPLAQLINDGDIVSDSIPEWSSNTNVFYSSAINYLSEVSPGTVVLAFSDQIFASDDWHVRFTQIGLDPSKQKLDILRRSLSDFFEVDNLKKFDFILIQPIPRVPGEIYEQTVNASFVHMPYVSSFSKATLDPSYSQMKKIFKDIALKFDMRTFDVSNFICESGRCNLKYFGTPIFKDRTHLSVEFVDNLYSSLLEIIWQT